MWMPYKNLYIGTELTIRFKLFRPPNIDTLFSTEKLSGIIVYAHSWVSIFSVKKILVPT